jgi:hypothetical protein
MITYITAFLDLKRDQWKTFGRTIDDYLQSFSPYIDLFKNSKEKLIVYIDETLMDRLSKMVSLSNITLIPINININEISELWRRLPRETEIMESVKYKKTFRERLHFPENSNPLYTLINHAKIDFVCDYIKKYGVDNDFYCWIDFGFFQKKEKIPKNLLDETKFEKDKITYTLINHIDERDNDVFYTMHNAPEKIGGFFFFGSGKVLLEYQKLYHHIHLEMQDNGLVDDDQHIALRCYFRKPKLFSLVLAGWHNAFLVFQKN